MNTHNAAPPDPIEGKDWQQVKAELIGLFGQVSEAARLLRCHSNTLRYAVEGRAPGVRARLVSLILKARAKRDARPAPAAA